MSPCCEHKNPDECPNHGKKGVTVHWAYEGSVHAREQEGGLADSAIELDGMTKQNGGQWVTLAQQLKQHFAIGPGEDYEDDKDLGLLRITVDRIDTVGPAD